MANGKRKKISPRWINIIKGLAVYVLVGLAALIFFVNLSGGSTPSNEVPISQVVNDVKDNKVEFNGQVLDLTKLPKLDEKTCYTVLDNKLIKIQFFSDETNLLRVL